jgi:TPR repeat protein
MMRNRESRLMWFAVLCCAAVTFAQPASDTDQHRRDVEALRRWYDECRRDDPVQLAERLDKWIAVHRDDAESMFLLSRVNFLRARRGDRAARKRNVQLLTAATALGQPSAMAHLGAITVKGEEGVKKDVVAGMELVRMAVAKDDPEAHLIYGAILKLRSDGGPPAREQAFEHIKTAADKGRVRAYAPLWVMYQEAGQGTEKIGVLRKGADAGDPQAQNILSKLLFEGEFVPRDRDTAVRLAAQAAEIGDPEYQRVAGQMYLEIGTPKAFPEAEKWLRLADKGGDMQARYLLSIGYANGVSDTDGDRDTAMRLLREAAEAGIPEAEEVLASHYLDGLLVGRDLKEARRWYERAKAHGNATAEKMLRWMDYAEKESKQSR